MSKSLFRNLFFNGVSYTVEYRIGEDLEGDGSCETLKATDDTFTTTLFPIHSRLVTVVVDISRYFCISYLS